MDCCAASGCGAGRRNHGSQATGPLPVAKNDTAKVAEFIRGGMVLAAYAGRADVVRALLAAGAQVNARSDRTWPPLLQRNPVNEFLGALGGHGPRPPRLVGGYTALRAARESGRMDVAKILSDAGGRE